MVGAIGIGAVMFASTNIDDIFVLLAFFADRRQKPGPIVVGQYLGIFALFFASLLLSKAALLLTPQQVGLLGVLPVLIGLGKLAGLRRRDMAAEAAPGHAAVGAVLSVAAVTIANGADNVGVYTPVFASSTGAGLWAMGAVFAVLTAVWLGFAHALVNNPRLGAFIGRYGPVAVPFVLIGLGLHILMQSGSVAWLAGLWRG